MDQFLGPDTDIMGEGNFMGDWMGGQFLFLIDLQKFGVAVVVVDKRHFKVLLWSKSLDLDLRLRPSLTTT